jgi:replicative DNA helicase
MLALYRDSEPIDVLTVAEQLRSAGRLEEAAEILASPYHKQASRQAC